MIGYKTVLMDPGDNLFDVGKGTIQKEMDSASLGHAGDDWAFGNEEGRSLLDDMFERREAHARMKGGKNISSSLNRNRRTIQRGLKASMLTTPRQSKGFKSKCPTSYTLVPRVRSAP